MARFCLTVPSVMVRFDPPTTATPPPTPGKNVPDPAAEPVSRAVDVGGDGERTPTSVGVALGTYAFMPPEQAAGRVEEVDKRSDVFGLGAILCTILTGQPPYQGPTEDHVLRQAMRGDLTDAEALDLANWLHGKFPPK